MDDGMGAIKILKSTFLPHCDDSEKTLAKNGKNFVHYTSAENALKIIRGKEVWLRSVRVMNDSSEVFHGIDRLINFFSADKDDFNEAFKGSYPGILKDAAEIFDNNRLNIEMNSFISCISEHERTEDSLGRLSMWRAYGRGVAGVAIVLRTEAFFCRSAALGVAFAPVVYGTDKEVSALMAAIKDNIKRESNSLKSIDRKTVIDFFYHTFCILALTIKHPGFKEEKEWRVISIPPNDRGQVKTSIEVVSGIPQHVQKIGLKNIPEEGLVGLELPELIDRIIIGPTAYPWPIRQAFVEELIAAGVQDAEKKVIISDIPLRA